MLRVALESGAMKLGRVALDGTKMKANASKHKAMSHGRIKQSEQQLAAEVKRMLAEAETVDAAEDARYGAAKQGEELPEELQRRQTRLEKIREAKQALEQRAKQRARQQAEAAGRCDEQARQAEPRDKDQYNFTDPESRIMKSGDGFVQGYNAQAAVENVAQLIVGQTLTQAANDKEQLAPLLEAVERQSGQRPEQVLPTAAIVRRRTWNRWKRPRSQSKRSTPISPLRNRIAGNGRRRRGGGYRTTPRESSGWIASYGRKRGRRFTRSAKGSWSRYSDRSNRPAAFVNFSCAG